jgi:ketosteroid isomerase-like protein
MTPELGETTIMIADPHAERDPLAIVQRLQAATNAHDLDKLVACFTDDYRSEIPLHPSRGFRGGEQVRRNWSQILSGVPDLHSELVRHAVDGEVVWAEWEWTGTRRDGEPHLMRGTTVIGVEGDRIAWTRFYMEPVVDDGLRIDAAVSLAVAPGSDR